MLISLAIVTGTALWVLFSSMELLMWLYQSLIRLYGQPAILKPRWITFVYLLTLDKSLFPTNIMI